MKRVRLALVPVALAGLMALSGCDLAPNDHTLPGSVATGSDGYQVSATFASVDNLVANSEVRYNNVDVGTVTAIKLDGWRARATLTLKKSVKLPANVHATIGQKSLLGAEYIELSDPSKPQGTLEEHDAISASDTGNYPGTEEVLSAVSLLLNNGGLSQLQTITTQLNDALNGRTEVTQQLINEVLKFTTELDDQKTDIVHAIGAMDSLSGKFAADKKTLADAIDKIGPGIKAVNANRQKLQNAVDKVGAFGDVARSVVQESGGLLESNLQALKPVLAQLNKAGTALPQATRLLTFPFPVENVDRVVRGDYANLFVTLDVTAGVVTSDFGLLGSTVSALQSANPLQAPLSAPATTSKAKGGGSTASGSGKSGAPPAAPATPATPNPTSPTAAPKTCGLVSALLGGC